MQRLLIFVVAYQAESTIESVLSRIPELVFQEFDTEILIIDDSSTDRTFEAGLRRSQAADRKMTVLFNERKQGYGGNQKLAFEYAIRHGFDSIVLLHGDGQYAPEVLLDLVRPLRDGVADAVLGSRMLVRGEARRSGMPLYKLAGNRILTALQNRILKTHLSEFHSGYRAYRLSALAALPFRFNDDGFAFDTELTIQLLMAERKLHEVPIPTYSGREFRRRNGLAYARSVLAATFASRLHTLGVFYKRRYDVEGASNRHYDLKLGYESSHTRALAEVAPGSVVLDVGCGDGAFARELLRKGCVVDGMDQYPPREPSPFRQFSRWDEATAGLDADLRTYDAILLLDVIEHLRRPEAFLDALRRSASALAKKPRLIVTTGNVAFLPVRLQLLFGNLNYGKRGILDLTHSRLYTFRTLTDLFEQCGFSVEAMDGIPGPFPKALGDSVFSRALVAINRAFIRVSRGLFSYQILMIASPTPTIDALLGDAIRSGASKSRAIGAASQGGVGLTETGSTRESDAVTPRR